MSEPQYGSQPERPDLNKPQEGTGPGQPPPSPGYGGPQQPQQPGYPPQGGGYPSQGGGFGGQQPQGFGGPGNEMAPAEQRQWAMFAHLSGLLNLLGGWAVVPVLVIYLVTKERGGFVRRQSAEALNFQITLLIGFVVGWVLTVVLVGFLILLALVIVAVIFAIMGGMAANRGEEYRYPFNIRLVS